MLAFITGSRAYGTIKPDSDIDLVVRVAPVVAAILEGFSESKAAVRFGRLNLILCTSDEKYAAWKLATSHMMQQSKQFNRDEAKKIICDLESMVDVKDGKDSDL